MAKELTNKTVTKEFIEKAMACGNAAELMKLAETEGYSLTKDEARRSWRSWATWSWAMK